MNLTEILAKYGIPYREHGQHHHTRQGWVQMDCPFCGKGSGKFHLGYAVSSGACNCWKCGKHTIREVVVAYLGVSFNQAREILSGVVTARDIARANRPQEVVIPDGVGDLLPAHKAYIRGRGFDPDEIAALWGVKGFGPMAPRRFRWRLFMPIDLHGVTVSWTSRSINPEASLRYLSASEEEESVPHKELLYGGDMVRGAVIVHEGPLDAWATGAGAVALCGTAYTSAQVRRLAEFPVRAICFDSEPKAQERARALAADLAAFGGATAVVQLETGTDAGSAHPDEIRELRAAFLESA